MFLWAFPNPESGLDSRVSVPTGRDWQKSVSEPEKRRNSRSRPILSKPLFLKICHSLFIKEACKIIACTEIAVFLYFGIYTLQHENKLILILITVFTILTSLFLLYADVKKKPRAYLPYIIFKASHFLLIKSKYMNCEWQGCAPTKAWVTKPVPVLFDVWFLFFF